MESLNRVSRIPEGCAGIVVALLLSCAPSQAATLASTDMNGWGLVIGEGVLAPEVKMRFALSGDSNGCWIPSPHCLVLLDTLLTSADIGRTFSINATSNPNFAHIAAALVDGTDNAWTFSKLPDPHGGVSTVQQDLPGYNVESVNLTIKNLAFGQVMLPSSLSTFDVFTEVSADVTIAVEGTQVPEPGTALLVAAGAILFLFGRLLRFASVRS